MSIATRSHRIPHEKVKLFTADFEWVLAISVNKLLGSSRAKLQKNLPKQSATVLVQARATKAPLDRSISLIVVSSCCRLSLECRQSRAMWGWKRVLNVKGRFWKQTKVYSKLIWCAIWRALRLSHRVLNDSLVAWNVVAGSVVVSFSSLQDVFLWFCRTTMTTSPPQYLAKAFPLQIGWGKRIHFQWLPGKRGLNFSLVTLGYGACAAVIESCWSPAILRFFQPPPPAFSNSNTY